MVHTASVIKREREEQDSVLQRSPLLNELIETPTLPSESVYFLSVSRNKRSVGARVSRFVSQQRFFLGATPFIRSPRPWMLVDSSGGRNCDDGQGYYTGNLS